MTDRRYNWQGGGNPYDDVFAAQDRRSAGGSITTAPANPDAAARANVLARQNGLPPDTIFRNLATFEKEARDKGAIRDVQSSDYLTRWYADPHNAASAQDDTTPLRSVAEHGGFFSALGNFARHPLNGVMGWIDAADRWVQNDTGKGQGVATPFVAATAALMGDPDAQARVPVAVRSTPGALKAGVATMASGALGYLRGTQEVAEKLDVTAGLQRRLFGNSIEGKVGALAQRGAAAADNYAQRTMPRSGDWITDQIVGGISNVPSTALGLGAGLAGRGLGLSVKAASLVGAASGGIVQGGQSYTTARDQGVDPGRAFLYANADALTETAGEYVGELGFLKATDAGKSVLTRFLHNQLGEQVGEQFSTIAQDFSAWVALPENRNKSIADFAVQLPGDMASTAVQTLVAGGISNVTIAGIERAANLPAFRTRQLAAEAQRTRADEAVMSSFMEAATQSKLRDRDPEAFEQFVRGLSQDTAAENVYLPAEAIRELHQDYRNDDFFADYADQIDEALALDGDVVIPTADVATRLAGTSSWERLKEEARFSAGGMSMAELNSLETSHREYMDRVGDDIAEQARAATEAAQPRNQVYQQVRDQLANAGFAPDAADRYAQLWAANREAWGARLGTDALAYHEANPVEFRRILPEALARIQAADGLDVVINAMRRGSEPVSDRRRLGPSLLEAIAANGGVDDAGGDLASMGADRWHREGAFRRKLIRRSAADLRTGDTQGEMLGSADGSRHGIDDVFQTLINAGYFPELRRDGGIEGGVDATGYGDKPDTQILLDAIDDELRGTPRYSEDNRADRSETDDVRRAARELRGLVERRGLDPDKASPADIRKAVELHQENTYRGDEADREVNQGVRGRALLNDEPGAIIDLFQGSDLSTVIHETGHVWLEELKRNATTDSAPAYVQSDWQVIRDWFAVNGSPVAEDGFIPTDAHEMWARAWERYAMEGKAPSSALQPAFNSFRGWLLSIYRHIRNLRVELTPEVRGVFDRMIATQDAIDEEAARQGVRALFTDAVQAGMTEAEFAAYQAATGSARTEAFDALLYRTMATIRASRTAEWKEQERGVRADVTSRINGRSDFKALHLLRTGRWLDDADREPMAVKLDRAWLVEQYGADALSLLPKGVPPIYSENGTDADVVAELVGFRNGDEMARALMGLETAQRLARAEGDKRNIRQRMIDAEVTAIMEERHGDPLRDGSIEEEALAAINNDRQGEVIASEARALGRQRGQVPTAYQVARDWASRKIAEGTVVEVASRAAIQRYARAAAKAARSAETALVARDVDEAFRQKQAQLLNHALLVEAKRAADEVDAIVSRMSKLARRATSKTIAQDHLDRAHALLEKFDFRPRSQSLLNEMQSFAAWAAEQQANGVDVVTPPRLEMEGEHYTRVSVEELRGLADSVDQIVHLGRLKQRLQDQGEQREWTAIYGEAEDAASHLAERAPESLMQGGTWDAVKKGVASMDAALLKMEAVFDWLDGGDRNGVFNRIAFRPIADAQAREQDMTRDYYGRMQALYDAVPAEDARRWQQAVVLPFIDRVTGRPMEMRRHQVIAMALNVGNEGNMQRLADGHGINAAATMDYLNQTLSAGEWQFVQGVWDAIDTLWPSIEAMEKRVNGVAPDRVEPRSFTTPHGPMRGGYYPAVYDTSRDYKAERRAAESDDLMGGLYTRASTRASATKDRAERVERPLLLQLGVINRHLGEVIHDLTHREAVIQAHRFLTNPRVMSAVDRTLGPEIRKQFRPWIKHVANSWAMERSGNEGFGRWIGKLRANATAVGMGLRASTMMTQIAGYSNSVEAVGAAGWPEALAQFTRNPFEAAQFVWARSGEMRHRMDTLDRDIGAQLAHMKGLHPATKAGQVLLDGQRFFFHGIGYMDMMVSIPTWLAAYNGATKGGATEEDASYAGDKAVRASQGAGAAKDLAAIQRGTGKWGEALKLMTMFYSFFSAQYQRQRTLARDVGGMDERRSRDVPKLAARAFFLLVLPPLLVEGIKYGLGGNGGPDDDEAWGQWVMRKLLANFIGPIPLARDVFEPAWNKAVGGGLTSASVTPLQRGYDAVIKSAGDLGNVARGQPTKQGTRDTLETAGYLTGMVPGQIAASTQFLVDVGAGDAHPETIWDWSEGLQTGRLKKDR